MRLLKIDLERYVSTKLVSAARRGQQRLRMPRGDANKASRILAEKHAILSVVLSDTELLVVRVACPSCGDGLVFHPGGQFTFCKCGLKPVTD